MKIWRRMRFRKKLIISYFTLFLMAVMLVVFNTVSASQTAIYNNNVNSVQGMIEKAADNFDRKVEQYNQILMQSVYNESLQIIYRNRRLTMYELYRKLTDVFQPYYSAIIANSGDEINRICMYSNTGLYKNKYMDSIEAIESNHWFEDAMSYNGILWHVEAEKIFATLKIDSINDLAHDESLGMLYLELNSNAILDNYVYINWPEYRLSLMDEAGKSLLTYETDDFTDESLVEFSAHSEALGWTLNFYIPRSTLVSGTDTARPMNYIIIAAACAILLILISVFTHSLMRGLAQLGKGIAQVNEGDLNVRVKSDAEDEIGILIKTFNGMLDTINNLMNKAREDERKLSSLEARALRAQIDPHFLYNTLSFINWKCMQAGQDDVSDMINQLSTFYRTCLNKGQNLTHVRTELANITSYVNIQLQLHDDSFNVVYDMPSEFMDYKMLSFVLQPIVENAILHGIDRRRDAGGELVIRLRCDQNKLIFSILDNGPGLSEEIRHQLNEAKANNTGYGVQNVRDRIVLNYGSEYGVYAENRKEGGCAVILTLPVLYDKDTNSES